MIQRTSELLEDPLKFQQLVWPDLKLYDKQVEIMYSVRDNDETFVPAGNGLGKDFISGMIAIWFFLSRSPARVITTSVDHSQLEGVLWGEIRRLVQDAAVPLPIELNHLHAYQVKNGVREPRSDLIGRVTNKGEGLLGRHLERGPNRQPRCLAIFDEASGLDDPAYESSDTWTHRKLIIGNCYPCENFFKRGVKGGTKEGHTVPGGDLKDPEDDSRYLRKVIRIKAEQSPNVALALKQKEANVKVTNEELVPGCVDYITYRNRRMLWDPIRQCIGLDADWWDGAETLLCPPEWLNRAETVAERLKKHRRAETIGVDPAEGGDSSVWSMVDYHGLIKQVRHKTPNTTDIPKITLGLMREFQVRAEDVCFDRGGGGKQHADYMREQGHAVTTVGFGESATDPDKYKRMRQSHQKEESAESMYVFKNRRMEMYFLIRMLIDPDLGHNFGIPAEYDELRRQLAPLPLQYDGEGRLFLPPKRKTNQNSKEKTLIDILGCSPDEADSLAIAVYRLHNRAQGTTAGAI